MRKNYRSVIRLVCVGILLVASGIVLVRKGVIPRFWERSAPVEQPMDVTEQPKAADDQKPQESQEPQAEKPELQTEKPQETQQQGDGKGDGTKKPDADKEPEAQKKPQETPAERLEAYLKQDPRTPTEAKGIFVTGAVAGTENTMPALVKLVEQTELNAMVIDIKNDTGEVTYKMKLPLSEEIGAEVRYVADMPGLIRHLKAKGIYLIARIVAVKDTILAEKKPEYALKNAYGSVFYDNQYQAWVNP